jgi:hypothetical protein
MLVYFFIIFFILPKSKRREFRFVILTIGIGTHVVRIRNETDKLEHKVRNVCIDVRTHELSNIYTICTSLKIRP